jgi:nodulation protein Z
VTRGYVVSRPDPTSNVGSNLASLAGAVLLAQKLGRALIVDWRGMSQLQDKSLNYFAEFFERRDTLLGVPTSYAPVAGAEYGRDAGTPWLSPNDAAAAVRGELQLTEAEFVVLELYHGPDRLMPGPEDGRFVFLRRFYREIAPEPGLRETIDRWADEHLGGRFVVGVNIRTGNGAYFGRGMPHAGRVNIEVLQDETRLVHALERAVRRLVRNLPRSVRAATATFYATDSEPMSRALSALPGAVTRRQTYPPPDSGDLYSFDGAPGVDRASVVDSLADMFLLARCDALIYNNSLFNQYARVLNGYFGGNMVHVDMLFAGPRLRSLAALARRRVRR